MTPLSKAVRRLTVGTHRGRRLVASLEPGDLLSLRPARTRREEIMPLAALYDYAVKCRVASERAAKRAERAERAKGKR